MKQIHKFAHQKQVLLGEDGVSYYAKRRKPWMAYVDHNNRMIYLGYYKTEAEALEVARLAREARNNGQYDDDEVTDA